MIFNEIYGCYYQAVAKMIGLAIKEELTEERMDEIARKYAFEESFLTIVPAIKNQQWQLIDEEYRTPIINEPKRPITVLEKQWLKTILQDPRVVLFEVPKVGLEDVEPFFDPKDVVYFDQYQDGDDYKNPAYIANFHKTVQAIKEQKKLRVKFCNGKKHEREAVYEPIKMEYSDKDDKFRMLCQFHEQVITINMGRVIACELLEESFPVKFKTITRKREILQFELIDERNTLERVMMQFAHYKKEVERLTEQTYHVTLEYDVDEETDVLIQIMSFGSLVNVLSPERMKDNISKRISNQLRMIGWL